MLTIRLQRAGKKNSPEFRIVLAQKEAAANKKFVEVLGSYNPRSKAFQVKEDRLQYWVSQHVELSPTMHNLLVSKSLLDAKKVKAFSVPKKPAEAPVEAAPAAPKAEGANTAAETAPVAENTEAVDNKTEEIVPETTPEA
jgi:small subunit ribosomal protein S16